MDVRDDDDVRISLLDEFLSFLLPFGRGIEFVVQ
jgi:hypothetical protein